MQIINQNFMWKSTLVFGKFLTAISCIIRKEKTVIHRRKREDIHRIRKKPLDSTEIYKNVYKSPEFYTG